MQLTRAFQTVSGKMIEWADKTVSHTNGLQKITRVNISILKLTGVIFPDYRDMLTPVLSDLSAFRNLCNSTLTITTLAKMSEAKKITIGHCFQLITHVSMTMHFLYSVGILSVKAGAKVASETGSSAGQSVLQAAWKLVSRNPRSTWICIGSTFCIAGLIAGYYQARNADERSKAISFDKCLLFANQAGKILIIALGGYQAPVFLGCLDLGVSLASYARFLILPRNTSQ